MNLHIEHATIHLSVPRLATTILGEMATAEFPAPDAGPQPPAHGQLWVGQGGNFICTLPALLGLPARHLIAAAKDGEALTFGPTDDVDGATSRIDGPGNTRALVARGGHPAAVFASNYEADGHSDFHLPSQLELLMACICAPQLFKKEGWYWSSTQHSRHGAFVQDFEGGISYWSDKGNEWRVRPFRWIPFNA